MKRLIIVLLAALFYFTTYAQQTFIKTINDLSPGLKLRVLPTSDQGWVLFSSDDLKLYKFNSCGDLQWAKKYMLPNLLSCSGEGNEIIITQTGGFIFLVRVQLNLNIRASVLTKLDASGNIIWTKLYGDPQWSHCPYSIAQDNAGNFILYANASPLGGGTVYNMISKINSNGNVIWTRFYNHGGFWGGAILTSDDGVLVRAGNLFMKTDSSGKVEWASRFSSAGTYNYLKPIEVSDGYIFNKYNNGTKEISFYKMDKSGNLLWSGRKTLNYFGNPPVLRKKNNGNFTAVFNKTIAGKNYTAVMEFDKDLNVIHQGVLNYDQPGVELLGFDVNFLNDNSPIVVGTATVNSVPNLFFAKMNSQYKTSCDTTLEVKIKIENVTQSFENTNVTSYNLNAVKKNYVVSSFITSTTTLCSVTIPLNLNIGRDTLLCPGATLTLKNSTSNLFDNYLWSNGDTTASITIAQSGTYWLRAINDCMADTVRDTIIVAVIDFPEPSLVSDTSICSNDPVVLDATIGGGTYRWHDGSTNPKFYASLPGEYYIDITYQNCTKRFKTDISDCEILIVPNVFTPNNDGKNDLFMIEYYGQKLYRLLIYNRWGQLVFESNDRNYHWDGRINENKDASTGTYFFSLKIGLSTSTGYLMLLR
ncbi:MAG: gliding motility-associated C-terminal domain-containing protein [Bacteroidetes bacterium]|nr:gliding motility-associated C-terminal domain-containing protein [Bacteroidota bacterium]